MNHAQFLVFLLIIVALGCGENNSSNRSVYKPPSRPEANVSPSGNDSSPVVTPTPIAWTPSVIDTQAKANPSPPEAKAPGASTTSTVNKTVDEVDSPTKSEPEYATLAVADLQKLADEGDPQASWVLGLRFELGIALGRSTRCVHPALAPVIVASL